MRYFTAGESHGPCLVAIVEEVPAGIKISAESINADLARRQSGYGRGERQTIENDTVEVLSGLRFGRTIGSPVALLVQNRDWENHADTMAPFGPAPQNLVREVCPRPGHADLVGALKRDADDCRDILERSSARETAARVAASGIAREFLAEVGVDIISYVTSIGSVHMEEEKPFMNAANYKPLDIEMSEVRCPDEAASKKMMEEIDLASKEKTSLGGTFRVVVSGLVPGLGSYDSAPARLSSRLGAALFSIPAIKGVEFGLGFKAAELQGKLVHDPILLEKGIGFTRSSNNAGGLEGGMTNGMPLIISLAMKPIPTQTSPLLSVNLDTLMPAQASKERSDVCAVPAAAVVAESEVAFVLADAYLKKFGSDNMTDIKANLQAYKERLRRAAR